MNADCLGTGWGQMPGTPSPELRRSGPWVSGVPGPISAVWAGQPQGLPCQNWGPQGEREFRGPWRVRQDLLGVRSKCLANSPCLPHLLLLSPQGLTGPIGPPGPAGANGEKVSPGSFSSLCLTSPTESPFRIFPRAVISPRPSSIVTLLPTGDCKE